MLKAVVTGFVLLAGASAALSDVVRPKPNPALLRQAAAAAAAPLSTTSASPSEPATTAPPAMRPLGPPAPSAVPAVAVPRDPNKGAVTNLPLPRYVSLKSNEGNARRGPGLSHRIDWVFTRVGMPLKVTAEHGHWRRVEDAEGVGGWVHYALVSGVRTVMVDEDMATFFSRPDTTSLAAFQAERGVVARLISCADGWCRVTIDGQRGWAPVSSLWGVTADEVID
ncbi:SH3 domain-containing protein [Pseudotabrizicola formosa]|uniref:SH3 domain-containing protein n=1 Tax=Pseudotabrizicola formosa TaxID=2030009 RepID=UPI000CD0EFF5